MNADELLSTRIKWWLQPVRTAYRDQAVFRAAFPELDSPAKIFESPSVTAKVARLAKTSDQVEDAIKAHRSSRDVKILEFGLLPAKTIGPNQEPGASRLQIHYEEEPTLQRSPSTQRRANPMTNDALATPRSLDPVVVEVLEDITRAVYRRKTPTSLRYRYFSMLDKHSRDCAIAAFKHLTHAGYLFPPFLVGRWALSNGWKTDDARLLDDYAAGVQAGVRYHHSDPYGFHAIEYWKRDAEGKLPWPDPGRRLPPGYAPLQRKD